MIAWWSFTSWHLHIISAYAPTMTCSVDVKEHFYEDFENAIKSAHWQDILIILRDFDARIGVNHGAWPNVIGKHGVQKKNSNDTLLLTRCLENQIVITNMMFQQATKCKTTWMHLCSGHCYLIYYFIVHHCDYQDVKITHAVWEAYMWSNQWLLRHSKWHWSFN